MTKWIIGAVVLVLVAGGAWWYFNGQSVADQGAAAQTAPTSTAPDTSDQALIQDSAAIDAQMQVLDAQQ